MNYQQVIADATKQITFQSVDADAATITVSEVGSGFSCFCAAAAAAVDAAKAQESLAAGVAVYEKAITTDVEVGSGF